jgi:hypothetical protein
VTELVFRPPAPSAPITWAMTRAAHESSTTSVSSSPGCKLRGHRLSRKRAQRTAPPAVWQVGFPVVAFAFTATDCALVSNADLFKQARLRR